MAHSPSGDSVVERVVRVLETFTPDRTAQHVSEIGRRAALPSSTAHRLVEELVTAGLLERDEEQRVRLGLRLWELALRGSSVLRLRQAALPAMERVQATVGQHTQLAVLEQDEALFIERLSSPEAGANIARVAGRLPLHASSAGLMLLAFAAPEVRERVLAAPLPRLGPGTLTQPEQLRRTLAEIRRTGQVVAPGSVEGVSTGVAVPVRDAGTVVAALSVILPRDTNPQPALAALAALRAAAGEIEAELRQTRA